MVGGLLANLGVGIVCLFPSSPLATGFLYFLALGFRLWHFDSKSEEFLDMVSITNLLLDVDCQKRYPMYQANSTNQVACFGRGSAFHQDLEQLPVDWEHGIISTANRFYVLKFSRIIHIIHSLCILASRFQISLLRVDDLFVLQELISQLLRDRRT